MDRYEKIRGLVVCILRAVAKIDKFILAARVINLVAASLQLFARLLRDT